MTRAVVERPSPEADRVRPGWLLGIAAVGLAAGLGLVATTLSPASSPSREPSPSRQPHERTPALPADDAAPEAPQAAPDGGAAEDDAQPTEPAGSAAVPAGDESAEAPAPLPEASRDGDGASPRAPTGTLRMIPGRVAYLRCEGVPLEDGPFPCPRDLPLEDRAWDALRTLPDCPMAPEAPGRADLRLHFRTAGTPEVRFLSRATDLDQARLRSCLEDTLTGLETALAPEAMVVSFRFELAPAP